MSERVELSSSIQLGCLPFDKYKEYPMPGVTVYAAGWGYTSPNGNKISDDLMNVELSVYEPTYCNNTFEPVSQICAGNYTG